MIRKYHILATLLLITFLLLITTMIPSTSIANKDEFNKSLDFRERFGLNAELNHVNNTLENKAKNKSIEMFGVPLTDGEFNEMVYRSKLSESSKELEEYLVNNYDKYYGGMYLDQKNGGVIKVGLVSLENLDDLQLRLEDLFIDKNRIQFFSTNHSLDKLKSIKSNVLNKYQEQVYDAWIDEKNNKIIVGFIDSTNNELTNMLEREYGDSYFTFVKSNLVVQRNTVHEPLVAGLEIEFKYLFSTNPKCTGAFSAYDSNGNYYYLTAGHCDDTIGRTVTQGGRDIGEIHAKSEGPYSDSMAIKIDKSNASNKQYGSINTYKYREGAFDDRVGDAVCISGNQAGVTCGEVVATDYENTNGGFQYLRLANYGPTYYGDSGAPIYGTKNSYFNAKGIHMGRVDTDNGGTINYGNYAVYSHIGWSLHELGLSDVVID